MDRWLVALRKESVDRNVILRKQLDRPAPSLSARRAWIEIRMALFPAPPTMVALRKESVDRNSKSRRNKNPMLKVALRKESVDRNLLLLVPVLVPSCCRSPQGERG